MDFLKKIEPIVSFMGSLDKSETIGLIFGLIFLLLSICAWLWICFSTGATFWSNRLITYHRRIGFQKTGESFLFNPRFLKIVATCFLVCVIVGAVLVAINLFKNGI